MLDGLRLCAALMVLAFHYLGDDGRQLWKQSTDRLHPLHRVAEYGHLGVLLFYMISGFVISMSAWGSSLGKFWRGRIIRLFPAYWFAVLLTSAYLHFSPHYPDTQHVTATQALTNLSMLQMPLGVENVDTVYWTLWVELRFYILFSVVVWMGTNDRRVATFCWIWALAAVLAPQSGVPLIVTLAIASYAPFFIAGVAFYLVRRRGGVDGELLALLALTWLLAQARMSAICGTHGRASLATVAVSAMYGVMYLVASGRTDRITWAWLPVAGAISYPLYLLHQAIGINLIHVFQPTLGGRPLLALLTVGMVAAAWLTHRLVERPGTRLLRNLTKRRVTTERVWVDRPGGTATG
ncbi:acyltransferase [Kitasatospora cinereorecta]|uniref:Acyltransferase family protein n=1 Tax=Kitasatospora cinereorecta TaxID=285560 RepID=A0ABW0VFN6_9ACTN